MSGAAPPLTVRPTTPADLGAVTAVLSERDGHPLVQEHVSTALYRLDPALLAGWIAEVGGEPAGLTTLYIREQRWGDRTIRTGYWSHLFVPERFRRLMIYPQLVLAMMRGIKGAGIDAIFTGTRRAHVAEGHVKLGFAKLGELGVLFRPLRPARLVARYRKLGSVVAAAGAPLDALYGAWFSATTTRRAKGCEVRAVDPAADLTTVTDLLNRAGEGRVSQVWTPATLARRLAGTIDGRRYTVLVAEDAGRVLGAAICGLAPRDGVEAGILMDVVGEPEARLVLTGEAQRTLRRLGADTTLYLDGLGPKERSLIAIGHRLSSETYQMLVWPKTLVPAGSAPANLANWRFGFLDHDAF